MKVQKDIVCTLIEMNVGDWSVFKFKLAKLSIKMVGDVHGESE